MHIWLRSVVHESWGCPAIAVIVIVLCWVNSASIDAVKDLIMAGPK